MTKQPTIKVIFDMDQCMVHTAEMPHRAVKDTYTVIEEVSDDSVRVSILRPSVVPLLKDLSARGWTLCVFTSGSKDLQELVLQKHGIRDYFQHVYASDDLRNGIKIDAAAFVLVDDLDVKFGSDAKLEALGVPQVKELALLIDNGSTTAEERKESIKKLKYIAADYFVQCQGWSGLYGDKEPEPLTALTPQIKGCIERQLRTESRYISLIPGRIPFVANQDERYDIPGDVKIAETTKQLEAFHPTFTVMSKGEFSALTVEGSRLMLAELFEHGVVRDKYKKLFPYIRFADPTHGGY